MTSGEYEYLLINEFVISAYTSEVSTALALNINAQARCESVRILTCVEAEEARKQQQAQAEEAREQQQAIAEQAREEQLAQASFQRRRQAALSRIAVTSVHIDCEFPLASSCGVFKLTAGIRNQSSETISMVSVGWAFIAEGENCPTSVQTKKYEEVQLSSGGTVVLNIEGLDGPESKEFRVCVKINDMQIVP